MKPPVIGSGPSLPPPDPLPALWTSAAILGVAGLGTLAFDNPLVPITQEFELIPLGLGGAIGAGLLRERYGPRTLAAFAVLMVWLVWRVWIAQTTGGIVLLAAALFSFTRALVRTAADD